MIRKRLLCTDPKSYYFNHKALTDTYIVLIVTHILYTTVCPGSSDPSKKYSNIFASENEVYTIFLLLLYFGLNIIRLQNKIILGHMN